MTSSARRRCRSSFPAAASPSLNMTHTETPLEPLAAARSQLEGKAQADRRGGLPQGGISRNVSAMRACAPMAIPASGRRAGSSAAIS